MFDKYYMISEGRFLKWYSIVCFIIMGLVLMIIMCAATFGLVGEASFTMSMIDERFRNMKDAEKVMKKKYADMTAKGDPM